MIVSAVKLEIQRFTGAKPVLHRSTVVALTCTLLTHVASGSLRDRLQCSSLRDEGGLVPGDRVRFFCSRPVFSRVTDSWRVHARL